ncbi:hypothetical protein ACEPAI_4980 [Sanghuangporus weigelae]
MLWQPGSGIVDITNPAAREWYAGKMESLLDLGVDCFKRTPHANVQFCDGSNSKRIRNTYSQLYNELVFILLEKRFGKNEAMIFARASTSGGQIPSCLAPKRTELE